MVKTCLRAPDSHPRHKAMDQRRTEGQLAQTEIYFSNLRNETHPFFLGTRKTKFPTDPRMMVKTCLRAPDSHPRHKAMDQRRAEVQLAQTENSFSYGGFQRRCSQLFPANPPKRYSIENSRFCFETEKLRPKQAT